MFENWAADVLANYLGKFVDVQRDRLKISLWGGEGKLENVQLRVDAFDYLQLPFIIKEGSIGRLKLQIPWGRWRGGALVVELSDVVLCVSSREEADWEEGPALGRAQAAKQAQLAAAELAKLGSRVAATGTGSGTQQHADYAAATAAGAAAGPAGGAAAAGPGLGSSWGWAIVDYISSFLLNRLQVEVRNVHVYFEAPSGSPSEYQAFGVQLGSLTTVVPSNVPSILAAFAGLKPVEPALTAKVVRQLHVQGWSCYWKPRRLQESQQQQQDHSNSGTAVKPSSAAAAGRRPTKPAAGPILDPTDYILAPVEAVLEIAVHNGVAAAAGSSKNSSNGSGLACDVFVGAPEVAMQLSSQQLVGMARLADDAAIWTKRNTYGRYRPRGWLTVVQALRQCSTQYMQLAQQQQKQQGRQGDSSSQHTVVPTGRCGAGAAVTWLEVWHYAVRATIADVRARRRKQQGRTLRKSEVMARRQYVHLYQQKLDSLQEQVPSSGVPAAISADTVHDRSPKNTTATADACTASAATASSKTSTSAEQASHAATAVAINATAASTVGKAAGSNVTPAADVAAELARLEQELEVEDILLCRSLAEVALDRRSASSSEAERYRSWFAWGTSGIASFLYPTTQQAAGASKPATGKASSSSSSGGGASMPTEADLDELLSLLHGQDAEGTSTGVSAAATTAAAVAGGTAGAEAAAAGTAAADAAGGSRAVQTRYAAAPAVSLNWQLLQLKAVLQDCPASGQRKELLLLDIKGTSIRGSIVGDKVSAQLAVQDLHLYDCCSDPGVRECILQRLDPASPVVAAAAAVTSLRPSQDRNSAAVAAPVLSSADGQGLHSSESHAAATASSQSLLSVSFQAAHSQRTISIGVDPLQLLARPGCVVGVFSMLQQLPGDTLQQQQLAAAAEIQAAPTVARAPGTTLQQQQQQLTVPAELLQVQLAVNVQQVLLVVPTELSYASGLNAVVHLQGLKIVPAMKQQHQQQGQRRRLWRQTEAEAKTAAGDEYEDECETDTDTGAYDQYSDELVLEEDSDALSSSSSSSGDSGDKADSDVTEEADNSSDSSSGVSSLAYTCASATAAAATAAAQSAATEASHMTQQQYMVQLAMLSVSMQHPVGSSSGRPQQQRVQELLRLPAVQGCLVLTPTAAAAAERPVPRAAAAAQLHMDHNNEHDGSSKSPSPLPSLQQQQQHHQQQQLQQPVARLLLQLPPLSATVTATLTSALQQFAAALPRQLQLSLADLQQCYRLSLPEQAAAVAKLQQQISPAQQQPQLQADHPGWSTAAAAAAAVLAAADVAWFECEVLLEELDLQYLDDAGTARQSRVPWQQQQQGIMNPDLHLRLQASMLHVNFRHSTHSSRAEVTFSDLVLQDMLPAPAAAGAYYSQAVGQTGHYMPEDNEHAAAAPDLKRLLNHVLLDECHVVWRQQLRESGVLQETHVSLLGLQAQGHPGDVGLFLLPAHQDSGTHVSVNISSSTPYKQHAAKPTAAQTSKISVQLTNIALGLDGVLKIVTAVEAASKKSPGVTSGQTKVDQVDGQPAPQQHYNNSSISRDSAAPEPSTTLQVQVLQCQVLSCSSGGSSLAAAAGDAQWWPWDVSLQDMQRTSSAATRSAAAPVAVEASMASLGAIAHSQHQQQQQVACDLLLDLPVVAVSITPQPAAATAAKCHGHGTHCKSRPMLLAEGLGLYLPETSGSDMLLPVISIPHVTFRQQQHQQHDGAATQGLAVDQHSGKLLMQSLHIPAVGASIRPTQIQHIVQLVQRQQQQWQQWSPTRPQQPRQQQQKPKQPKQQVDTSLTGAVDDLQLLLLPAPGTSDKGLLLQWQQLQVKYLESQSYTQQQQQGQPAAAAAPLPPDISADVGWKELTLSAVQQDGTHGSDSSNWLHNTAATAAAAGGAQERPVDVAQHEDSVQHQLQEHTHDAADVLHQQEPAEFRLQAVQLPAINWLRCGGSSNTSERPNHHHQQQQADDAVGVATLGSAFASAAAAAAVADGNAAVARPVASGPSAMLQTHATLSRFLSAKESWRSVDFGSSFSSANDAFFSPRSSGAFLSAASSMASSSSGMTNWASVLGSSSSGISRVSSSRPSPAIPAPLAGRSSGSAAAVPAASAAAAVPIASQDSIIAASWQLDPPGSSPPGTAGIWGSSPGLRGPGMSGLFGPENQATAAAAAAGPPSSLARTPAAAIPVRQQSYQQQQQQQRQSKSFEAQRASSSPSLPGFGASVDFGQGFSSFSHRRRGPSPPDASGASFRSSHSLHRVSFSSQGLGARDNSSRLGLAHSFGSHWQDHDDEFFSVAGESSLADDLSISGDSDTGGVSPAVKAGQGMQDVEDDIKCQLLPMAGFGAYGCEASARWLLLSLTAGLQCSSDSAAGDPGRCSGMPAAVQLTIKYDPPSHDQSVTAAAAEAAATIVSSTLHRSQHQQQYAGIVQRVAVTTLGWQLQVNAKCWDMAAACLMQAMNAAAAAARQQGMIVYDPSSGWGQQDSAVATSQAAAAAASMSVQVHVQQLQVMLFTPPNDAPDTAAAARQQQQAPVGMMQDSGKDFGPWQDPDSNTSPTAATVGASRVSPFSSPFLSPVKELEAADSGSAAFDSAAEVLVARLDASVALGTAGNTSHHTGHQLRDPQQQVLQLQDVTVPELSVSVGAVAWDEVRARPTTDIQQQQQQQQHLLLLLLKDGRLSAAAGQMTHQHHQQQQQSWSALHHSTMEDLSVTRLLDDSIMITPAAANAPYMATSLITAAAAGGVPAYSVSLGSISGWVSTVRLSLLANLQQVLQQQLPAVTAAVDLAGPSKHRGGAAAAAAIQLNRMESPMQPDVYIQSARSLQVSAAAAATASVNTGDYSYSLDGTAASRARRRGSQPAPAAADGFSCKLTVNKVAVLISTDEPEPWLLQHSSSSNSRVMLTTAGLRSPCSVRASAAAADATGAFTTCTTPLLEVVLMPLSVNVDLAGQPAAGAAEYSRSADGAPGHGIDVRVIGALRADVFSVDKLGWEPVLDPWDLQVSVQAALDSSSTASSAAKQSLKATVTASNLLDITVAPSCIIAIRQLQTLTADAVAWQADTERLQQLLLCLSSPCAAAALASGGRGCWLVNQTGTALNYTVSDAASGPAAAAAMALASSGSGSNSSSPGLTAAVPGTRGRAAHQVPVPLQVLDTVSAGYHGRFVESQATTADHATPGSSNNKTAAASSASPDQAASAAKRCQLLYLQAAGQLNVIGPIALEQLGCSLHSVSLPAPAGVGGLASWTLAGGAAVLNRRARQQQLVVEVSRHRYGGRLVSLHSTVQLVNSSNLELQLGCWGPLGLTGEPVVLDVVQPGGSMWLPLQVLQSAGPSLCLRPSGLAQTYSWCRALDVLSLLPTTSAARTAAADSSSNSSNAAQPSATAAAAAAVDDTGFWYCPPKPKPASQYISFRPFIQQQQQRGASPRLDKSASTAAAGQTVDADSAAAVGQVVLSLGCCAKPWQGPHSCTAAAGSITSSSSATSGASSAPSLWQIVIEAPATFTNQLPVPVELSVIAGKGDVRGLKAVVDSRQSLPLYGCEAQYLSKIRIRPQGFQSSSWLPVNTGGRVTLGGSSAATAVEGCQQVVEDLEVQVSGSRSDQLAQTLQLRSSRSSLTGSLAVTVSCSLWLFNCLGFQVAIKQPDAGGSAATVDGSSRASSSPVLKPSFASRSFNRLDKLSSTAATAAAAGSSPMLWLRPYPWLSDCIGSSVAIDDATSPTWQKQRDPTGGSGGSSTGAAAALARSASTPALGSLGLGALTSPEPQSKAVVLADITAAAEQPVQGQAPSTQARVRFDPGMAGLMSNIDHRSDRGSCSGTQSLQIPSISQSSERLQQQASLSATGSMALDAEQYGQQHQQQRGRGIRKSLSSSSLAVPQLLYLQQQQSWAAGSSAPAAQHLQARPQSAYGTAADPDVAAVHALHPGLDPVSMAAAAAAAGVGRMGRQRRHSSGLFMLASGRLPSMLLQETAHAPPSGLPGHALQQQLSVSGPLSQAAYVGSSSTPDRPVVYPLQNPDMPGSWLPLLAAGDLSCGCTVPAAAAAVWSAERAETAPAAARQQRSAVAAAAAEQLLQDINEQQQQRRCAPAGDREASSLPVGLGSLARAASTGLSSDAPYGVAARSTKSAAGPASPRSGFADLTPTAASAAAAGARSAFDGQSQYAGSDAMLSPTTAAAATSADTPVLCGWPCQTVNGSSSSSVTSPGGIHSSNAAPGRTAAGSDQLASSIQLQLCAAPAAVAAAVAGRGLQLPSKWSLPATVELREGGSGPASILKLPLVLPSADATMHGKSTSLGGLESVAAAAEGTSSRSMRTSISSGTLASLDSATSSIGAAVQPGQRTSAAWARWSQGGTVAQQQGVCFVSVHTAPVPNGGGAWAVHLLPTYLLVNTLQCEVQIRQYGSDIILQAVPPGGHCCILWPDDKLPLKLQFRAAEPGWSWSGAAAVEAPGEFLVKIRHRNRGETLLLQLDVAAASSGSSMVATLSARQGGFAPYRIENCSCETIHVQQVGCVEQEDVLQPYSSLPFAWDEPSLPHRVLLFLPGHRLLGEIPLEQIGQLRRISITSSTKKRTLLLTTYAEGPMRVLRVVDTSTHLLQQPGAVYPVSRSSRAAAAARGSTASGSATAAAVSGGGLSSYSSQGSLGHLSRTSSNAQLQALSRSSSSTSLTSNAQQTAKQQQQKGAGSSSSNAQGGSAVSAVGRPFERYQMLRRLSAFLGISAQQQQQQHEGLYRCDSSVASIPSPSIDLQVQLQGLGVSLVSDTRELLYTCARGITARVCQDAVRNALGLCISSIRVENTLYGSQYPLLLVSPVSRSVFGVVVPQAATAAVSSSSSATSSVAVAGQNTATAAEGVSSSTELGPVATDAANDSNNSGQPQGQLQTDLNPEGTASGATQPLQQQHSALLPHHLALGVLATVWRSQPSGVICVEQLGLQVSPLALSLEGKHIKHLVDFFSSLTAAAADTAAVAAGNAPSSSSGRLQQQQQQQLVPVKPPGLPAAAVKQSQVKLYLEEVRISPVTLCVSFAPDSWFDPLPGAASTVTRGSGSSVLSDLSHVGPVVTLGGLSLGVPDEASGTSGTNGVSATADGSGSQPSVEAAEATIAAAAEVYGSSNSTTGGQQLPIWLQMALALAHAEEGAWLTLAAFESSHTCINTDSLGQVLGRHYILAAYRELPKVLASLDIFGDPARLLQALGLGFWHLLTLPAHSARWGPYRSLQRLLRGVRVMAYGISSSIAKGSKRSKAALLPLVPAGLTWQQQQQPSGQQQQASLMFPGIVSSGTAATSKDSETALGALLRISEGGTSILASGSSSSGSSSSSEGAGGQDLLHVLVAGYSLSFQQMLRSFQAGQPVRGVITAAAQALVLPALLLLEISESTAASFRRLLIEQVAGAVPVRVPRYVAAGQLLRPYDRLESLGRALLYHTPGSFTCEEFLGCVELYPGLYAVVTVGHLMIVGAGSTSQHQQPQAVHIQYKHPDLLLVLGVKDVMMVAVEGSAVRLLCMAGDQATGSLAPGATGPSSSTTAAADGTVLAEVAPRVGDSISSPVSTGMGSPAKHLAAAGAADREAGAEDSGGSSGLRGLMAGPEQHQQQLGGGRSLDTDAGSSSDGSGAEGLINNNQAMPAASGKELVEHNTRGFPAAAAPGTADITAAAAAADAAVAATSSSAANAAEQALQSGLGAQGLGAEGFMGGKWFVGHVVPCGSEEVARQLQQLLQRACSRLDTLIASSVWQRQVML